MRVSTYNTTNLLFTILYFEFIEQAEKAYSNQELELEVDLDFLFPCGLGVCVLPFPLWFSMLLTLICMRVWRIRFFTLHLFFHFLTPTL